MYVKVLDKKKKFFNDHIFKVIEVGDNYEFIEGQFKGSVIPKDDCEVVRELTTVNDDIIDAMKLLGMALQLTTNDVFHKKVADYLEGVENKLKVYNRFVAILCDVIGVEESKVSFESRIVEDFGVDGIDNIEVIIRTEREFDIVIKNDSFLTSGKTVEECVIEIINIIKG